MRTPSLLSQCLAGGSQSVWAERSGQPPSPAVEILPSKQVPHAHNIGEARDFQGLHLSKGRINVWSINNFSGWDIITSKSDGSTKVWESAIDLVNVLKHEIRDGKLNLRGKRVLELSCNVGLPGIFACMKGASAVHFQDVNAETIRCATIPNVMANLEQAREKQARQPENPLTPERETFSPTVKFFAGEWDELHTVLSTVSTAVEFSFSEEDFTEVCSSHDCSVHEMPARRSRKLSGSRAWERASEADQGEGGYDVILIAEITCSLSSFKKLNSLIKKCLRPPYGVVYLATKRNYGGFGGGGKNIRSLVEEESVFGVHLVKETTDRVVWKFFLK